MNLNSLPRAASLFTTTLALALSAASLAQMPMDATGAMPPGHPEIAPPLPDNMDTTSVGRVTVQVRQHAPDSPPVTSGDVTLELQHRGHVMQTLTAAIDDHGHAVFENVPVGIPVVAVAQYEHQGVRFTAESEPLNAETPNTDIELTICDTTTEKPDLAVSSRHVMARATPHGLMVQEMLVIANPADKVWAPIDLTASPVATSPSEPHPGLTFLLPLPPTAANLRLGQGLTPDNSTVVDHNLQFRSPLLPGDNSITIAYVIPLQDGQAVLPLRSTLPTKQVMVFLPSDGSSIQAQGLSDSGAMTAGPGEVRAFRASDVPADQTLTLTVRPGQAMTMPSDAATTEPSAAPPAPAQQPTPPYTPQSEVPAPTAPSGSARTLALAGGAVLLVLGVIMALARRSKKS
ncbi:MAG: hypothetical protein IT441_05150 [Phycisphaeraceae bacterium]|nr:hypothetical protein [Phycisphaeraceae bacterium]